MNNSSGDGSVGPDTDNSMTDNGHPANGGNGHGDKSLELSLLNNKEEDEEEGSSCELTPTNTIKDLEQSPTKSPGVEEPDGVVDSKEERGELEHTVTGRETLNSVAARYDITPSRLVEANKLGMSRMLFPGQVLRIPPPSPPPPPPPPQSEEEPDIIEYQFIKLKVRHITCGKGVVAGSVLITPNAIIFDPDPKDPLVEELEPEAFQVIAPMELVVNAAIFDDFFPIGNTKKTAGRENPPSKLLMRRGGSAGSRKQRRPGRQDSGSDKAEENNDNNSSSESETEEEAGEDFTDLKQDPYYLRLTMGTPVGKEVARSTPTMAYGRQIMMPEYWFIVPSRQVGHLYKFLTRWFPEIYAPFDLEEIHEMGFELVPDPEDQSPTSPPAASSFSQRGPLLPAPSVDLELPELVEQSGLVSEEQRTLLHRHFPPRLQAVPWIRVFSTQQHGYSLHSLYRKVADVDGSVLLLIQDTDHVLFGALLSCPPSVAENFQGTGESWLFTFFPSFKVYQWTGENNYIVQGSHTSLVIGSSQGKFGIWLDEAFNNGRSQSVATFNNKPLPGKEDFVVNDIECWAFSYC